MAVAVAESGEELVNVFTEVRCLASGPDLQPEHPPIPIALVGNVTAEEIEEVRRLVRPPSVVRRTLEATVLILQAGRSPCVLAPPPWPRVQRKLAQETFFQDLINFNVGHLRAAPLLILFGLGVLWCAPAGRACSEASQRPAILFVGGPNLWTCPAC